MASITVRMKSGEVRQFPHKGRPGGSYTKHIRYEWAFVIITDEWEQETAIPAADIAEVVTRQEKRW